MIKIGVDANGGDFGVNSTVPGAMQAIKMFKDIEIVLYGDEAKIKPLLTNSERISIVHTDVTVDMGEHDPVHAVRKQKDSSLCMVMNAAKNGEVDAVVTNGPTQVVVMAAHLIIRRLKQMERVALCPIIPNCDGKYRLFLDSGANVELRPEHIGNFAIFATVAAKELLGVENPSVGYLNIGSEPGKGRQIDQACHEYLKNLAGINFYGNVEPNQVIDCPTDIVVTDGFAGNICIKTLEGTAKGTGKILKQEIKSSLISKIGYLFVKKALDRYKNRLNPSEVGGALIFGIGKPVVKAHGNSDGYTIACAIKQARLMVQTDLINKVVSQLPQEEVKKDEGAN